MEGLRIFCSYLYVGGVFDEKLLTTKFEEALGKLKDKMLLLGYTDYSKTCDEIAKMIDEGMKERRRDDEAICNN